ncbi:GNAT family protein [Anaerolineales bacterium]
MVCIQIDGQIQLVSFGLNDTDVLHTLISENRTHLDSWLRWTAAVQSPEQVASLIQSFMEKEIIEDGFHAGIWYEGNLVGGLVCHYINRLSHKAEIGYWLAQSAVGKGIIRRCCLSVLALLFEQEQLHRVEIQAAVENRRSRSVAEALGLRFEGIKRESEWINGQYMDHAVYSILAQEWAQTK